MNLSMRIRLIWSVIGISAGLMAGPIFLYRYNNYAVFYLGLFSSLCATYLFYIHWAFYKMWMHNWTRIKVKLVIYINGIICITAFALMIVFLTWATVVAEPLISQGNNKWMIAVWSWMTSKWSMTSSIYAYTYSKKVLMQYLLPVNNPNYDSIYDRDLLQRFNAPISSLTCNAQTQTIY